MKKNIFFIIFLICYDTYAEQFMYPVAALQDKQQLLVVYQKSLTDIQLCIWDIHEHCAKKCLSSFMTPANLQLLPSGKGFSFIDAGYIKIKEFLKRSPKTLPIYEPIGLFSNINWIDDDRFYFVAREGDYFQIFQSDLNANVYRLTCDMADALYPQKIGAQLFYMQRDEEIQTQIIKIDYNPMDMHHNFKNVKNHDMIIHKSQEQLCFLKMLSSHEGFYLQAPQQKKADGTYVFSCFHFIEIDEHGWHHEKLFDFQIPIKYLTGLDRLYESIEPFLPNYTRKELVFFVTWEKDTEQFHVLKFDMKTKTIERIGYEHQKEKIFAPFIYENKIFCGLIQQDFKSLHNIFEDENLYFKLPCLDQK